MCLRASRTLIRHWVEAGSGWRLTLVWWVSARVERAVWINVRFPRIWAICFKLHVITAKRVSSYTVCLKFFLTCSYLFPFLSFIFLLFFLSSFFFFEIQENLQEWSAWEGSDTRGRKVSQQGEERQGREDGAIQGQEGTASSTSQPLDIFPA